MPVYALGVPLAIIFGYAGYHLLREPVFLIGRTALINIEEVRELAGLLICAGWLGALLLLRQGSGDFSDGK